MIYKIYTSRYETIKFLYGLGKGHQQFKFFYIVYTLQELRSDWQYIKGIYLYDI